MTWTHVLRNRAFEAVVWGFMVGITAVSVNFMALPPSEDRAFVPSGSSPQAVSPVPASIPSVGEVR